MLFENMDIALVMKRLSVAILPLLFSIIVHEVAHGWVALKRGDPTAAMAGRITFNPIPHIDPMGILFFVLTSFSGAFVLGWAKPVPINPRRFHNLVKDTMIVAFAGPASNFILAFIAAALLKAYIIFLPFEVWQESSAWEYGLLVLYTAVSLNFTLAWFNLMPIPPLDGSKILWGVLPEPLATQYQGLERYGFMLLILLLMIGAFRFVLLPLVSFSTSFVFTLFHLPF